MVIHGNRLEDLRDLLTAWLARTPLRPLEDETVLVQSNGIAQWLKLALARPPEEGGLGISAAVRMQLPGRFLWDAYRAVLGDSAVPETSPFDKSRLTWRLLRLLPSVAGQADFEPLADFLASGDWNRRFQLAERIADLFDQYQVYRADWLADWEAGQLLLRDESRGRSAALPQEQRWQAHLWRLLIEDVPPALRHGHRAAVHRAFVERLASGGPRPPGLPRRIVVFGLSSLPQQTLEALTALSRHVQVFLAVGNPCRHYWADIIEERELLRAEHRRHAPKPGSPAEPRFEDLHLHANPLLAAWGKQGRDFIRLLDAFDRPERYRDRFVAWQRGIDLFTDVVDPAHPRLLHQVQQAILDLEPLPAAGEPAKSWKAGDESLHFHIAHNRQREVEILHDRLLALFEQAARDGQPLAPRDVMVMVPDIQSYAPHIQAVFGRIPENDPRYLPHSVADRHDRGAMPLAVALERLLALPDARFAVSEILDLLDVPAVQRRFDIDPNDLPLLRRWIEGAGVRWGLDAEQIASLQLPAIGQNSWLAGLRRMLLGYAVGDGALWNGIAPYGEVGGLDAATIGPLQDLLDRLTLYWRDLREPLPPDAWVERLHALLDAFFDVDGDSNDSDLRGRLLDALEAWQQACRDAGFVEPLPIDIVREHWLSSIDDMRLTQRFMGGAVSFGTLMPMRAIPFRAICLLGMNDGDYPRRQAPADFDLMTQPGSNRPGDRSRREDDRYLFLEALLSARDHLHISWIGLNERDNTVLPPSVLVGQLRDYLAAGWQASDGAPLLSQLTAVHPLQAFSQRYFDPHSNIATYAVEWERARRQATPDKESTLPEALPETALSIGNLQSFLARPVRYFFNHRLKVYFDEADTEVVDDEPFALGGLERYQAEQTLLAAALTAKAPEEAIAAASDRLQAQGALPPGGFGVLARTELDESVGALAALWRTFDESYPERLAPVELRLSAGGRQIEDWLNDLRHDGAGLLRLALIQGGLHDNRAFRHDKLIAPWVVHLLANAQGLHLSTRIVAVDAQPLLHPIDAEQARTLLDHLLAALDQGLTRPLPVAMRTAFAWLQAERAQKSPTEAAAACYDGTGFSAGECQHDAYLRRAWPRFATLYAGGFEASLSLYRPLMDVLTGEASE